MRPREKIIILLILVTLTLGGLIFFAFKDNEVEGNYYRWVLAANLKQGLSAPLEFFDKLPAGSLFYGGLTLFAVVMTLFFLKMLRDGEIQALRKRLADVRAEKNQTDSLLQEQVWKDKSVRQAKDLVTRDLETSIEKIETLIAELSAKEEQLKARDVELLALKADDSPARGGVPVSDRRLRAELNTKN